MSDIKGLYPAICTPLNSNGELDLLSLEKVIQHSSSPKIVSGLVVLGHAGELLLLNRDERLRVIEKSRELLDPNLQIVSGVEGNSPRFLAQAGKDAVSAGADVLLVLPPFDVRATRPLASDLKTVLTYFEELSDAVDVPLIVFQYSRSSGCAYTLDILESLSKLPNVKAIKAGTRNITDYVLIRERVRGMVSMLAASDGPPLLSMLLHGAEGALIGVSGVGTSIWASLLEMTQAGDVKNANEFFIDNCLPLTTAIYENQAPTTLISPVAAAKEALYQMGIIANPTVKSPLIYPDEARKTQITKALQRTGLLP